MQSIRIVSRTVMLPAELNDTPTAIAIYDKLPINGIVRTWGEEIYFEIPITAEQEPDARADVEVGELGYWPMGNAFCIFYGPTPVSIDDTPRAYSPVNIIGRIVGDVSKLKSIADGDPITIKQII